MIDSALSPMLPSRVFASVLSQLIKAMMTKNPIYQHVRDKLGTHGVERTEDGKLTVNDQKLFSLFVALERAVRDSSFDAVQRASIDIENYLVSIGKRQLMAFAYMYLKFSDFTPKLTELDEKLPDGTIRKCRVFTRDVTDEQMLIGQWASVKFDQIGEIYLRTVYRDS